MTGRRPRILLGAAAAAVVVGVLASIPQQYTPTTTRLWAQALSLGIAALGLNLLTGYNGQVSIGHGAFFGLGMYTTALLMHQHGWSFVATLPVAAGLSFAVGVLAGFPALRVKGLSLALVTLGLAVLFPDLTKHYVHVTGGTNLVSLDQSELAAPTWVPARASAPDQWAFYATLVIGLVLVVALYLMVNSRFGRALIAVRDHEAAAETVGINVSFVKVLAFALSGLYAGVAGSCAVLVTTLANADKVGTFQLSIELLVAVVIGGSATIVGPLLGAGLVVFAQHFISVDLPGKIGSGGLVQRVVSNRASSPAIFGVLLILFVFVLPDGLVGAYRRVLALVGRRLGRPNPIAVTTRKDMAP